MMNNRLFKQTARNNSIRQSSFETASQATNSHYFTCLKGNDVISGKVSDHHPIIHDGVLFWNVMMQGKKRANGYNNGFGIVESHVEYMHRLHKIANVIAELLSRHPGIDVISLCEGPIQLLHVNKLLQSLKKHTSLHKFFIDGEDSFYKPSSEEGLDWGLLMLADKSYKVDKIKYDDIDVHEHSLKNRFQLWRLASNHGEKFIALGHFPFKGDEHVSDKSNLSPHGREYCNLINNLLKKYENEQMIICADFNFNPYLISEWKDRAVDNIAHHNSILLTKEEKTNHSNVKTVTVDGILLSAKEKQKYCYLRFNLGLFSRLTNELSNLIKNLPTDTNGPIVHNEEIGTKKTDLVRLA